mmetsp:Transcript_25355/g.22473  ORF Transcript_25355/g.22473 Transcript_25355/m.22473 type:complete len:102 (+) Transcript_25355:1-306(+)
MDSSSDVSIKIPFPRTMKSSYHIKSGLIANRYKTKFMPTHKPKYYNVQKLNELAKAKWPKKKITKIKLSLKPQNQNPKIQFKNFKILWTPKINSCNKSPLK